MWGTIGLILIGMGWIPEVIETIKTKHSNLNIYFASLYTFGSLALTIYALNSEDLIFIILNGFAFFMGATALYYVIKSRETKKEVKKFLRKMRK